MQADELQPAYVPGRQAEQLTAPPDETHPAGHCGGTMVAASGQCRAAGHGRHTEAPDRDMKSPGAHTSHSRAQPPAHARPGGQSIGGDPPG
eukprot:1369210-Rhodomonas_salina.1